MPYLSSMLPSHDQHLILVSIKINACLGLTEQQFVNESFIYPNPTNGILQINAPSVFSGSEIKLIDIEGKIVSNWTNWKGSQLDLVDLDKGIYILELNNRDSIVRKRVILN